MDLPALRTFLEEHAHTIFAFMDYEPTLESEQALARTLGFWFRDDGWAATGHRFVHLGIDGTGGQIAAWIRPGAEPPYPIVLFGSEGGRGVLAATPADWVRVIAHAPFIDDYVHPATATTYSAMLDENEHSPEQVARAQHHLDIYRDAVEDLLGALPPLEQLIDGLDELNREFSAWMNGCR